MEMFLIIALQLLMEVWSYNIPNIKASPDVLTKSRSFNLTCESPADVTVIQCYFYANRQNENQVVRLSPCHLSLTGAEVLSWTGVKSPVSLDIGCYYTTDVRGVHKPSPHSPPATLTILNALKKPVISVKESAALLSIKCEIPASVRADFICNLYTEDGSLTHRSHSQKSQSRKHFCPFYLSPDEIFADEQTNNSRELSCDYVLNIKPAEMSPRSDTYTIRDVTKTPHRSADYTGVGLTVPLLSAALGICMCVIMGLICIHQCIHHSSPMMNNSSEDSGADDVLTVVVYSTSTWHPQTKEHLF
ncbi:uncharacterized protein LOC130571450 [Triplophysa rosa]|uniref:uncharacterized protein LOC130571450 n=1 Tax=Triplophysa rosa TaxID=992332 RepID=UPI00254605DA|nr:uncharacterized protein LOC130571450 [Triplophysa rosa]